MEERRGTGGDSGRYRICVGGILDPRWSAWFDGITIVHEIDTTVLLTDLVDQSALYGIIAKLRNLGLTLVSVVRDW